MIRNVTILTALGIALTLGPGCRKDPEPASQPAGEPVPAIPADKPGEPLDPTPAPPTPSEEPTGDDTTELLPAEPAGTVADDGASETTDAETPGAPSLPEGRTARSACMRACNKAQICGTATRGVTDCLSACLEAMNADSDEGRADSRGYLAQDRCADQPCGDFATCVQRTLVGERAVRDAKPLDVKVAEKQCHAICEKEKECGPDLFAQRRRTLEACEQACGLAMVTDQPTAAVQRAVLKKSFGCVEKPCGEFEACVRE